MKDIDISTPVGAGIGTRVLMRGPCLPIASTPATLRVAPAHVTTPADDTPDTPEHSSHHRFHRHHGSPHTTRHHHHPLEHLEIAGAIVAATVLIGLEAAAAVSHADRTGLALKATAIEAGAAPRATTDGDLDTTAAATIDAAGASGTITAASATTPAERSRVRVTLPSTKMPPELIDSISANVSAVSGCTHTLLGDTVVTAAHCKQPGFTVSGDIAWKGPDPTFAEASTIPNGSTIYAVGYPQATPGAQSFSLSSLGVRTVTVDHQPVEVLMTEGSGTACSYGASGMIGWVTINGEMVPIGPLSVFATDPAITGLPAGQYVCGFATS